MAEYIEREALLDAIINDHQDLVFYSKREAIECIAAEPAADVVEAPQEYAYYTDFDDENYLVHLTIPISEKQFKDLGEGADLWKTLRMDGE